MAVGIAFREAGSGSESITRGGESLSAVLSARASKSHLSLPVFHSYPVSGQRAQVIENAMQKVTKIIHMGLDTYGFVISRSPVQARRVAPCFQ
jgi:hypothetical protein